MAPYLLAIELKPNFTVSRTTAKYCKNAVTFGDKNNNYIFKVLISQNHLKNRLIMGAGESI